MCSHLSLNPRTMAPFLCVNLVFPLITDKVGGGAFLHSTYEYCTMGVIDTHTHTQRLRPIYSSATIIHKDLFSSL